LPVSASNITPAPVLKQRAAQLSVASNSILIVIKLIAGILTGSVAILTDAVHSSIDMIASVVALVSIRKAGEPADESHRYGHEKMENLAAAIEGVLILVGSAVIAFAAIRRLLVHGQTQKLGLGIAVVSVAIVVNLIVSSVLRRSARATGSPALAGDALHLLTDAASSAAVLVALVLVDLTGAQWLDPAVALLVAAVILVTGVRLTSRSGQVLVDQALPPEEVSAIRAAIEPFAAQGVVGYHALRTRRGGSQRYVDAHVQFRSGTSLEQAHRTAHQLTDAIAAALGGADVLIHLEPADRVRPGETLVKLSDPAQASARVAASASSMDAVERGTGGMGPGA
jgi:cation diffusion facilitator family transporter